MESFSFFHVIVSQLLSCFKLPNTFIIGMKCHRKSFATYVILYVLYHPGLRKMIWHNGFFFFSFFQLHLNTAKTDGPTVHSASLEITIGIRGELWRFVVIFCSKQNVSSRLYTES